jgi:hypothetical protein
LDFLVFFNAITWGGWNNPNFILFLLNDNEPKISLFVSKHLKGSLVMVFFFKLKNLIPFPCSSSSPSL